MILHSYIFSFEGRIILKKFVLKLYLFFTPFIIFIVSVCAVARFTDEIGKYDVLIKSQREQHEALLGLAYNQPMAYYKKTNANYYQKEVIALGTSRVMQFSSEYFNNCFYNCGGGVSTNYNEYINFLKNLNYTPEVIILGLDQWVFNYAWSGESDAYDTYQEITYSSCGNYTVIKNLCMDYFDGKWRFHTINNYPENYGMNGRVKNNGFVWDGMYYYGDYYVDPSLATEGIKDTLSRIERGNARFEWGETISEITIIQLGNLLKYCDENSIFVIGFLPPFAPVCYDAMKDSGNYTYIDKIIKEIKPMFEEYKFDIYDYSNGAILGTDDDFYIDGFHGSDIVYNLIIQDFMRNSHSLDEFVDGEKLLSLYDNRYSNKTFFVSQ